MSDDLLLEKSRVLMFFAKTIHKSYLWKDYMRISEQFSFLTKKEIVLLLSQ